MMHGRKNFRSLVLSYTLYIFRDDSYLKEVSELFLNNLIGVGWRGKVGIAIMDVTRDILFYD